MDSNARIFVSGHRGLVGSAICRRLSAEGAKNLILVTKTELDLRKPVGRGPVLLNGKTGIRVLGGREGRRHPSQLVVSSRFP
jgi:nucleoside-diphosphate-sugar epimerase